MSELILEIGFTESEVTVNSFFYSKLFVFGLPGAYLAIWYCRFYLEIVNKYPYYFGLVFGLLLVFAGVLSGIILRRSYDLNRFYPLFYLLLLAFFPVINSVFGMVLLSVLCGISISAFKLIDKKFSVYSFLTLGICCFLFGAEYFLNVYIDLVLGSMVVLALLIDAMLKNRHFFGKNIFTLLALGVVVFSLYSLSMEFQSEICRKVDGKFIANTPLGVVETSFDNNKSEILNHRNQLIEVKLERNNNQNSILPILLQRNKKDLNVLYIGYAPSSVPFWLGSSFLVNDIDALYWGNYMNTQGKLLNFHLFPGFELWKKELSGKKLKYDVVFVEHLPGEDILPRRIFMRYVRNALLDGNGILVYPENLFLPQDGRPMKIFPENSLVFIQNAETTDNPEVLVERAKKFLNLNTENDGGVLIEFLPEKLAEVQLAARKNLIYETPTKLPFTPAMINFTLWGLLIGYLLFRLFKSRRDNRLVLFYALENGFVAGIVMVSTIYICSQYRLVFPFFVPAASTLMVLFMPSLRKKQKGWICEGLLLWLLIYLALPHLVYVLHPLVFLLPGLWFAIVAIAHSQNRFHEDWGRPDVKDYYSFCGGMLICLLLMLLSRDNGFYDKLIYLALFFRVMMYLKI